MELIEYKVLVEDGDEYWYNENDKLHRTNGPAIVLASGEEFYYINGRGMTHQEYSSRPIEMTLSQVERLLGKKIKIVKD